MTSLKTLLKDRKLWRASGAVFCLILLGLAVAFPRLVLPVLALLCGSLFFLYGLKSYASIAVIMLSTSGANGNGNGDGQKNGNGGRAGILGRLRNGRGHDHKNGIVNGKPFKLPADKQPFISIQLPMYNEDRVVDRLLSACTQLDYENYEVLVADDSSDQTLHTLERWAKHPKVRVSHRINRSGFKGAALKHASEVMNPKAQFVAVFDADFIPPPDILHQFLSYFYGVGSSNGDELNLIDESLAVVQGYQWHVLNASENWITRAIRAEFAGSYVIERSTQELTGGMKMISGSVFMIRADVLRQHKWGTSITEDWELTLRLYLDGYKVLYTPFIQAPAECVSDFKQLTRQRMRWAEGHTFNVKRFFLPVMRSPKLSLREKLEFIYYAPYYLTSVLFMLGTAAWMISELFLRVQLPYWSEVFGWSLVFTNSAALILMNLAGLFQERGVRRSWMGLFSFALLTFLLVPYQAYAALKGLLEPHEGGWHRTRKSGVVTDVVKRMGLGLRMPKLLPKKKKSGFDLGKRLPAVARLSRWIPQPVRHAAARTGVGLMASGMLGGLLILGLLSKTVNLASAAPDSFYLHPTAASGIGPAGENMNGTVGSDGSTRVFNTVGQEAYWYVDQTWPTGSNDATITSGSYTANLYFDQLTSSGLPQFDAASVDITVYAHHTALDGSDATLITSADATVTGSTSNPLVLSLGSGSKQTFTSSEPRLLRLWVEVTGVSGGGSFTLAYDSPADPSRLDTPVATVADSTLIRLAGAIFVPPLSSLIVKRPRLALRLLSVGTSLLLVLGILSQNVMTASAAPDVFYLHNNATSGITPAGKYMNTTAGTGGSTLAFNTPGQNAYWYTDLSYPTGNDNGGIAAGTYTANMEFSQLPTGGSPQVDAVNTGSGTGTTVNVTHTVSGNDRLMLVGISTLADEVVSSVVWDPTGANQSLSLVTGCNQLAGVGEIWIYQLVAPATGTSLTLGVTFAASASSVVGVTSFTGVDQTTPLGTCVVASGDPGPATVTVTSAPGELVFDTVASDENVTADASQNVRWDLATPVFAGGSTKAGASSVTMSWTAGSTTWAIGAVPIKPAGSGSVDITVYAQHTATDGSGATTITSASTTITSSTSNPLALNLGNGLQQTFSSGNPRLLRTWIEVTGVSGGGSFTLAYDSASDPSNLATPVVTVPEWGAAILFLAPLVPFLMSYVWKRRRRAAQLASVLLAAIMAVGALAGTVEQVTAAPDTHYLHPTATSGITPAGEYMNINSGSGGSTKAFNTGGQDAYWYVDATWPTGNDNATIAAGTYTFNMYFANRPGAGSGDYPAVATTNTSTTTTAGTSHTLNLPSGISSGDTLIAMLSGFYGSGSTPVDISWPSGWTEFFEQDATTSTLHLAVAGAWRKADGTEGSSITVTTNLSVLAAHHSYRITGAADPTVLPPEAATIGYTDTSATIDPPSLSPTGGAKDYLWLAVAGYRRSGRTMTGTPTNYTNLLDVNSGGNTAGTRLGSMRRQLNAASEDPGAFTLSGTSERRVGVTIAVHPAASVDIQVTVSHTAADGSGATTIVTSSTTTINASTADPYALNIGSGAQQTFTSSSPRRLRVRVNVVSVNSGGDFTLDYDGTCGSSLCSNLDTPVVTVPEYALVFLPLALLIPVAVPLMKKRRTRPTQVGKENSDGQ